MITNDRNKLDNELYKVGDFVTFYESFEISGEFLDDMDEEAEVVFENCTVTKPMLTELDEWYDNQVASTDEYGNFEFEDFPCTWPVEVIKGHSPDYTKGVNGIHDVSTRGN